MYSCTTLTLVLEEEPDFSFLDNFGYEEMKGYNLPSSCMWIGRRHA
uniref:Uncharacterized protein n=1 Tax=Arundo donax TaxID=35708 RepID=A0A0A8ZL50_ARUDO